MFNKFDENYYYRKCFFKSEPQVPTQSQMKQKMGEALAQVYFKSMSHKHKVLAGLEPPLKGGGSDWFVPPQDILNTKAVLRPIKKQHLEKLSYLGIDGFSMKLVEDHQRRMEEEKTQKLLENDAYWKKQIMQICGAYWDEKSKDASKFNTERIQHAFQEFTTIYTTSINKVEALLFDATIKAVEEVKNEASQKMQKHYETLLKQQATMLYDRYEAKLEKTKEKLKANFIKKLEEAREATGNELQEIHTEKHVAVEKLRHLLECQTLACQVYVALKEREECKKEMDLAKHEHKKKVKRLQEKINIKDLEITLAIEKEKKRREFNRIWQKKICEVIKKFQIFVAYSLNLLPEYAEFFSNMEKLMMLQLEEAADNPSAESIFEPEPEKFSTPVPNPHPFFLCCDKGFKPQVDRKLCPAHYTASAEQMPVIVVNKRCIYAACDNFELFTDKITEFISGQRGQDTDFDDDHVYTYDVPVKYTSSTQLLELKLESSLMQVLQKERPNVNNLPLKCCICKVPYCFCSPIRPSRKTSHEAIKPKKEESVHSIASGNKIKTRTEELEHERQPKWESYMDFVKPTKCRCGKTAKKHLQEHLPAYMTNMSSFVAPELPNYEPCSLETLKRLVRKAQGKRPPPPPPVKLPSKTKEICTQTSDQEFEQLCTCFSDDEIERLFREIMGDSKLCKRGEASQFKVVDGSISDTHLGQRSSSFATDRVMSLRNLLDKSPELEDIFKRDNCSFKSSQL